MEFKNPIFIVCLVGLIVIGVVANLILIQMKPSKSFSKGTAAISDLTPKSGITTPMASLTSMPESVSTSSVVTSTPAATTIMPNFNLTGKEESNGPLSFSPSPTPIILLKSSISSTLPSMVSPTPETKITPTPTPTPPTPTPSPTPAPVPMTIIDLSHNGGGGYAFGVASDEVKRWQTFTVQSYLNQSLDYLNLVNIEVKICKWDGTTQSDAIVELYATSNGQPAGSPLAWAVIPAHTITADYQVISVPLPYYGLRVGATYAVVLGKKFPNLPIITGVWKK